MTTSCPVSTLSSIAVGPEITFENLTMVLPSRRTAALRFLGALACAPAHTAPALGMGEDIRRSAHGLTGAALSVDGVIVHLSGFAVKGSRQVLWSRDHCVFCVQTH
jgi:hypothetical protein